MHEEKISNKLYYFNIALTFLVIILIFTLDFKAEKKKIIVKKPTEVVRNLDAFTKLKLKAKAVSVYDVNSGRTIFAINSDTQLPLASITKLMTALTAVELLGEDSKITIKSEFLREEGDSGLAISESWNLKDLLDFSLVSSSNDGARSVASVIGAAKLNSPDYDLGRKQFIEKMNVKAKDIGLKQAFFVNETGLDVGDVSGGYASATDVSNLMKYLIQKHPEVIEATRYESLNIKSDSKNHKAQNTNDIVNSIPGLIASKTGFTDLAGGNLVIAFDASLNKPIIVTVLGSTQNGRFEDVQKLVNASLEYFAQ